MKKETCKEIIDILDRCIERTIKRVSNNITYRPFHETLLTKELVAASAFERSFSTSFGQGPIEEITKILALATGAECSRQKETRVNVNKGAVDEIGRILNALRDGVSSPNWKKEVARISAFTKGDFVQARILSDIWMKRNGSEIFISIKTVKPNIDQSEIAKKDMLMLKAHDPEYKTYFGLYYNPGGPKRNDYNWSIPFKIFDMARDECVLIGQEYWDFVGGNNAYRDLLDIFAEVGTKTRIRLKKLGH